MSEFIRQIRKFSFFIRLEACEEVGNRHGEVKIRPATGANGLEILLQRAAHEQLAPRELHGQAVADARERMQVLVMQVEHGIVQNALEFLAVPVQPGDVDDQRFLHSLTLRASDAAARQA